MRSRKSRTAYSPPHAAAVHDRTAHAAGLFGKPWVVFSLCPPAQEEPPGQVCQTLPPTDVVFGYAVAEEVDSCLQ